MRNGPLIKTLIAILIILAVGMGSLAWYLLSHGFSANTPPSAAEAWIATNVRRLAIPADARGAMNPVPASSEALQEAMEHFADHCSTCHGNDGRGRTHIGAGLYPPPPDMSLNGTQKLSDGELYFIIENGIRFTGMPAFGQKAGDVQDEATWKLVRFIRHLPMITDDELALMATMNPKSPKDLENEKRIQEFLEGGDVLPVESSPQHHH